jgi:hypothetical protein
MTLTVGKIYAYILCNKFDPMRSGDGSVGRSVNWVGTEQAADPGIRGVGPLRAADR